MKAAQSYPSLCDPMDYTIHGMLQTRILEWLAFPFSRGSSQPRDRTEVSCIAGGFFTSWAMREAPSGLCHTVAAGTEHHLDCHVDSTILAGWARAAGEFCLHEPGLTWHGEENTLECNDQVWSENLPKAMFYHFYPERNSCPDWKLPENRHFESFIN